MVVVVVGVVVIAVVVKAYGHRHPQPSANDIPSVAMERCDMGYVLTCVFIIVELFCNVCTYILSSPK